MTSHAVTVAVCFLTSAACLAGYDHFVARPARLIGIVDVAEVYRAKETEFAGVVTSSRDDRDREKAMEMATDFAKRLPVALEELPRDCKCLVMLNSAVAGRSANTVDLTGLLREKLARP